MEKLIKNKLILAGIVFCAAFYSCTATRSRRALKTDSLSIHAAAGRSILTDNLHRDEEMIQIVESRGGTTWMLEIIPDGDFTFSPELGYSGRAKSLRLSGRDSIDAVSAMKRVSGIRQSHTERSDSSVLKVLKSKTAAKAIENKKPAYQLWFLTACCVVLIILICRYRSWLRL